MKRYLFAVTVSLLLFSVPSVAATYDIPTWADSNPQGGMWALTYSSVSNWTSGSQLGYMVDGGTYWKSPNATVPSVQKGTDPLWQNNGHTGWNDAGVLVFQAPQTGYYSVNLTWASYGLMGDPTTEYLAVKTAPDLATATTTLWETSHSWEAGSGFIYSDDLSGVAAVQDIYLTAGSYIFFSMSVQEQAYYPGAYNRFLSTATSSGDWGSIMYTVPEPATMLLIGSGLAGFGFRRNRK